ncbi:MAG: hypothetical protein PHD48_09850 [Alphaproteobacteria bacterium]|nr:hypothetical protein [Alphaproteobacteria bacterium]
MTEVSPVAQQGVISTQVERVQSERPVSAEPVRETQTPAAPPPPPPVDSGRGATVDTTA